MRRLHFRYRIQIIQAIFFTIVSWIISWFYPSKEIWLFRERGCDARDNGYWMFRYVKERHPEIDAYYAVTKDSPDRGRLKPWEDSIIEQNSFRHHVYMWRASHMLSTHICGGYPNMVRGIKLLYYFVTWLSPKKTIWLQHGVILNDINIPACRYNNLDMIACSTRFEYDFLHDYCGYSERVLKLTGLARWDQLHDCKVKHEQILFMPTWRKWLTKENFIKSDYFRIVVELLTMPELHVFLTEHHMTLVFYPHHEVQPYLSLFCQYSLPDCIQIADKEHYDVLQLLAESALLITDYSSISMDFAYMRKPLIYYLFDYAEFREEHYPQGFFDYYDGYGPWAENATDLLCHIKKIFRDEMQMDTEYLEKTVCDFLIYDRHNSDRIFDSILEI